MKLSSRLLKTTTKNLLKNKTYYDLRERTAAKRQPLRPEFLFFGNGCLP